MSFFGKLNINIYSTKKLNGLSSQYLLVLFQPYYPNELANYLNSNFYCLPLCRTTFYNNSYNPSTIKSWNALDAEIENSSTLSILK